MDGLDGLFFDLLDVVVKKMIKVVKKCGYVMYDELNEVLLLE